MFKTLQQLKDSISSIIRNATIQAPVSRDNLSGLFDDIADTMFEISKYGSVFYFSHQDTGLSDGSSWQNAKAFTVEAYNAVADNTACLFLGDGTKKYILSSTLNVVSGKPVYGGFVGIGMLRENSTVTLQNEDWTSVKFSKFATVFEGGNFKGFNNNGYISNICVGNCSATGDGSAVVNKSFCYNITITNCSSTVGGAIYNAASSTSPNCTVINCSASYGGGIYNDGATSPNCTVINCTAVNLSGGIYNKIDASSPNCTVINCSAAYGGGISNLDSSTSPNCTVTNCSASNGGGGIYNAGSVTSPNCTVTNCSAVNNGGGIYNSASSSSINCTVTNCSASNGGGIYSVSDGLSDGSKIVGCYAPVNPASNYLTGLKSYWNNTITQESRVS